MFIDEKLITEINQIQLDIFREVIKVCEELNIDYYMVHGSLLGSILREAFMPFDDDIDIAMHREDYEKFISTAQNIISKKYFVQTNATDKHYPLEFAKVRNSQTTYITDGTSHLDINHGIYIDIFPIDYYPEGFIASRWYDFILKILNIRIGCRFRNVNKKFKTKVFQSLSRILLPSWVKAVGLRKKINNSVSESKKIVLSGGKPQEKGIPYKWFDKFEIHQFEGLSIKVPVGFKQYLSSIYGDYKNRTLVENKMNDKNEVEINACVVDTKKSYTEYLKYS